MKTLFKDEFESGFQIQSGLIIFGFKVIFINNSILKQIKIHIIKADKSVMNGLELCLTIFSWIFQLKLRCLLYVHLMLMLVEIIHV